MTGNLPGQHFVAELAGASSNNSPTVISLFPLSFKWEKAGSGGVFFSPQPFGPAGRGEKRKGEKKKERERERVPNTIFLILLGCSGASSYWYNWKIKVFMAGARGAFPLLVRPKINKT
jgi:hypothetical protein